MSVVEQACIFLGRISKRHRPASKVTVKRDCGNLPHRGDLSEVTDTSTKGVSGRFSKYYLEKIANLETASARQ